jgi:predicted Rossmann fold flavoprotein
MKQYQFEVLVNWVPGMNEQQVTEQLRLNRQDSGRQQVGGRSQFSLPQRLWEYLLDRSSIPYSVRWADLAREQQSALARNLCACSFSVQGKTTFKEEFVTAGGVSLQEIDHRTMMSKKVKHLYFAGEVMDVDGITGGFNFQHAWTSGYLAAASIASDESGL